MGDVALTVPAIRKVLAENNGLRITLVTAPHFTPFFNGIQGLKVFPANFHKEYKGLKGLVHLYKNLASLQNFDAVIDLHGVIRSYIVSLLFVLSGRNVFRIDKGRKQKKDFIKGKTNKKLPHTLERYLEVFRKTGLNTGGGSYKGFIIEDHVLETAKSILPPEIQQKDITWIGIAPMARHALKRWDLANFTDLMKRINQEHKVWFFFFGGGEHEKTEIDSLISGFENTLNLTGKMSLSQEIAIISKMRFMISMDSANMHISALCGTPTISIWGGTHPGLGFSALNQPDKFSIQIPETELECRPCTVYGKGECAREDLACMKLITSELVFKRLKKLNLLQHPFYCNSGNNGEYNVNPIVQGTAIITISSKGEEIETRDFVVEAVSDPVAKVGGKTGGEINKEFLLEQDKVTAEIENFTLDIEFRITAFTVSVTKDGNTVEEKSDSNILTAKQKELIESQESGQIIVFSDIQSIGPDGAIRNLNPVEFTLQ